MKGRSFKLMFLFTGILLFLCSAILQDTKPTKEETVAFMKKTAESTIGSKTFCSEIVKEVILTENSYHVKTISQYGTVSTYTYIIIWEKLSSVQRLDTELQLQRIRIYAPGVLLKAKIGDRKEIETILGSMEFYVPKDKVESFKKACLR